MITIPAEGRIRWVFYGSEGLRAGWGALLFLVLVAAPLIIVNLVLRFGFHMHRPHNADEGPLALIVTEAIGIAATAFATLVMARIERKSVARYGFAPIRPATMMVRGLAVGLVFLSLLVLVLWAIGVMYFDALLLHGVGIPEYAVIWAFAFLLVGISEESLFRGYLFATLTRGIGFWPAALACAALFGLGHTFNPGENVAGIASVALASLFFCVLLRATGSLWCCFGVHAAWDWAQSFLYGVPDSSLMFRHHLLASHATGAKLLTGGPDGPEGSLLCVVLLVVGIVVLVPFHRVPAE
jgi:membrane protease YdiL (CAAX protease family)